MRFPHPAIRAALGLAACLATPSLAQKKDPKPAAPRIVHCVPLAIEPGTTTKVTVRGLRVDEATEIRLHEPKSTGRIVGKGKKTPPPPNTEPAKVGDSEIEVEFTLPVETPGGTVPFSLIGPGGESSRHLLILRDDTPVVVEKEPNDGFRNPQMIAVPCVVEGTIRQPQDVDVFRFQGSKGGRLRIEIQAGRFGSPLDGAITLHDAAGRIIASADDGPDNPDPVLDVVLPATGVFYIALIDAHDQGGAGFLYRLIVRPSR